MQKFWLKLREVILLLMIVNMCICNRFDVTPADYVSMIVTEYGMVSLLYLESSGCLVIRLGHVAFNVFVPSYTRRGVCWVDLAIFLSVLVFSGGNNVPNWLKLKKCQVNTGQTGQVTYC